MKIRYLRDGAVAQLRKSIADNLDSYRTGDFGFIDLDSSQFHELPVDVKASGLGNMKMPSGADDFEVENCLAVHEYLEALSPYEARDERLWSYLTHTSMLQYTRARWPIPSDDDKAVPHIETHFFARTNRQIERDNAVSRLWWMAHLCTRVQGVAQKDALEAFLYRSDVRANIIERPTVAQATNVFGVILKSLIKSAAGKKVLFERATFRKVMMELNSIGGFKLLDALPEPELNQIFDDVIYQRLGLSAI
ncbi:DUF6339 family protein [Sphingopyxis indica]|uniref:Uncharacterized protein n=1 Tax=Sphingopyxis indica TaxID=436663 RepID=A0A239DF59_9SPHN|nr:DUF6339 family protein [Sphingopyxis indica]SNS31035.1 hypothetical protein SAMN06295955_101239 [Sphingopyxis indica]